VNEFISSNDLTAIWLTLQLAFVSTLLLLLISIPIAWKLSRSRSRFKPLIEALIALPLVLPPTVIGFYLLISFAPHSALGQSWQTLFDSRLAFSFSALVIGSVIYSLPFVVQPLKHTFDHLPYKLLEAASTMGSSPSNQMRHLVLPWSRAGIISAAMLGFAHTIGEFGIILMIGGNIPGETQVLSIALYDKVEALEYTQAHWLAGGLMLFSLLMLTALYSLQANKPRGSASWV
jgi:molybdate transport system permease protein